MRRAAAMNEEVWRRGARARRAGEKARKDNERRRDRIASRAHEGETDEDDVPRDVRHEDAIEPQNTQRIDDTGNARQHDQDARERAVALVINEPAPDLVQPQRG
jgi:hypothetical protein